MARHRILPLVATIMAIALLMHAQAAPPPDSSPAPSPGVHDYFNKLKARPEKVAEYSLRDPEQIEQYRHAPKGLTMNVSYDPAKDTDPRRQDAAKISIPAGQVSLKTTVRLPIPKTRDGTLLVTWDAWFGKEFAFEKTGIGNYKNFQFASGRIWTEVRARWKLAKPPALAMVDVRQYGGKSEDEDPNKGPEVDGIRYGGSVLEPMKAGFDIQPETWTRYWVQFKPAAEGWFEFSLWMADEKRDAVQVLDGVKIKPNEPNHDYWTDLWLEYNSSSNKENPPARTGYFRNTVMLKNVADPKAVFERPLGSPAAPATQPANPAK